MFLALQNRNLVEQGKARLTPLLAVHVLLIRMYIVGKVPVSIIVLRNKAVRVDRCVSGPGVDLCQRIVFVNEQDAIAIFLKECWKKLLVHTRAIRALEIVVVHSDNFGIFVATSRASRCVDLFHQIGIRIFAQVHLSHADERFAILRDQEGDVLLAFAGAKRDGQSVIVGELTGLGGTHSDLYIYRKTIGRAHLALDTLAKLG